MKVYVENRNKYLIMKYLSFLIYILEEKEKVKQM